MNAVDWSSSHSHVSGTFNAAGAALGLAAVNSGFHLGIPGIAVLAASAAGAVGSAIHGAHTEATKSSMWHRAACWLAAGGWLSYAIDRPWSWPVIATLSGLALLLGTSGAALYNQKKRAQHRAALADAAVGRARKGDEWVERFARVCRVEGCEIIGVQHWKVDKIGAPAKDSGGYTLEVKLPKGGATWRTIQGYQENLAADADLPEGCGVDVRPGVSRGVFLCKVSTVNMLLQSRNISHDVTPLDFNDDFDIGYERDGAEAMVNMRESSGLLVGQKRSGKTNELQVFISRFMRMPNVLVWVIDFNGGGIALPWLHSWANAGRPGNSPIDWVASTNAEAEAMTAMFVAIAKHRKTAYQAHMIKHNTDLLPLTPEIPGIVMIADEGAEIFVNPKRRAIAENYYEGLRIAGAVGLNELTCGLRATGDTLGDPIVRTQSQLRVGMRMADEAEMSYLFGWNSKLTPADMPNQGSGAVSRSDTEPPRPFKGWRVEPEDMAAIEAGTRDLRGELDEISRSVAPEVYNGRWSAERSGHLFDGTTPPDDGPVPVSVGEVEVAQEEPNLFKHAKSQTPEESLKNLRDAVEAAGGPARSEVEEFQRVLNEAGVVDPRDPSTWPDGVSQSVAEEEPDEDGNTESETVNLQALVYGIVKASSPQGIRPADIVKALERAELGVKIPVTKTIRRWLDADDRVWKPTGYSEYAVKPEHLQ